MELSRAERDDLFVIRLNSGVFSYPTVLNLSLTIDDYDHSISADLAI